MESEVNLGKPWIHRLDAVRYGGLGRGYCHRRQKGFMLPDGLAVLGVSPKALAAMETAKLPRTLFDFRDRGPAWRRRRSIIAGLWRCLCGWRQNKMSICAKRKPLVGGLGGRDVYSDV